MQTTTRTSYFGNIKNAFGGIVFGLLLIIAAPALLFWNEGRSVDRSRALEEGRGVVVSLASPQIDAANNNTLVHTSGEVTTEESPQDSFGVSENAIAIIRTVETYQWQEETSTESRDDARGGTTTTTDYSYQRVWSERDINSANFQDQSKNLNQPKPFDSQRVNAEVVKLGELALTGSLINKIPARQSLNVDPADFPNIPAGFTQFDGYLVNSSSPTSPEIGDVRIKYTTVPAQTISVVARQLSGTLQPYVAETGSIELVSAGIKTADDMFTAAEEENRLITWAIRAGGTLGMFIGFNLIFGVLPALARIIPFAKGITGFITGLISLLLTAIIAPAIIAFAWLFHRPLISLAVMGSGALVAITAFILIRKQQSKTA